MRFYYYKNDNQKEIKKIDRDNIVTDICKKVKTWSEDLNEVRLDYERVIKELFPSKNASKTKIKLIPDVYEQAQTYKANLFKSTYSNYDGMFDIEGLDDRSHNISAILKSSLVYDFYKIQLKNTLDAILDDWVTKGECAWFIHWDVDVERKREQDTETSQDEDGNDVIAIINKMVANVTHSGADVKRIDPLNLFYDKSQRHNWDMCGKIYRDFAPLQYVLANQNYKLTPQEKAELKQTISQMNQDNIDDLASEKQNLDSHIVGNTVEVLEYYGDYIIPDKGDIARNVIITVIAGKYLAQIEEMEYPICPVGYANYLERPDSSRGQTPLKPTLLLNELENRCMDLQMEAWHLTVNPPMLAPKGMINTGTRLQAGRPFEYSFDVFEGAPPPKPMDFSAGMRGFDFQEFFKKKMEGATGISPYLQGTGGLGAVRTASESTYIYSGQSTRLSREAYLFSEKVILPIVYNFFRMKKEFETGIKTIPVKERGTLAFAQVDDEVRNGDYTFMIGNAQTSVEREQYVMKIMELLQAPVFQTITQRPEFPAMEFMKWVLNEVNFRQIDTLVNSITFRDNIAQEGLARGVKPNNMGGFVNDMEANMRGAIPQFADMLAQQPTGNEIPQ